MTTSEFTKKSHIHQKEIVAWANGEEIQVMYGKWETITHTPSWSESCKYRVKPTVEQELLNFIQCNVIASNHHTKDIVENLMCKFNITLREDK